MTQLTESSPSALPPLVLFGSGIVSQLASSRHFDPAQTCDCYKEVEVLDPSCTKFLAKEKDCFQNENSRSSKCHFGFVGKKPCLQTGPLACIVRGYLWIKKDGLFGEELSVSEAPTPDVTGSKQRHAARWTNFLGPTSVGGRPIYYSSEVPISRINTEGVVKRIRKMANFTPDPHAEGSDELDGEEVEVVHNYIGHQSSTSPSHLPPKRFQSHINPSTPRNFQPMLSTIPTIPPASPSSSITRPAFIPAVRPSPIPQSRNSPKVTSQQLQPVASSSRRREKLATFPFASTQVFQQREHFPIWVTREDPKTASKNHDAVARLFRRVDRNNRDVIEYSNDRTIPGTSFEEMAANISWYEDELINDFQTNFAHFGRDN
ncbi:hypothetical protein O181_030129 [Austropuccinia psidii MF-1]|uniref:Uncharacterized protein n=1 Tax=Austropuccinia psidii MF-1 TaxID=1389203 RepID=A0A9Q3CTH6_9BASI|nr:hypothetical protein [Austropuccinia psidii MF-1]